MVRITPSLYPFYQFYNSIGLFIITQAAFVRSFLAIIDLKKYKWVTVKK
jgi:hypothetical protein